MVVMSNDITRLLTPLSLTLQLGVDGVFADFIEGLVFYLRFRRQNAEFPKAQVCVPV